MIIKKQPSISLATIVLLSFFFLPKAESLHLSYNGEKKNKTEELKELKEAEEQKKIDLLLPGLPGSSSIGRKLLC